MIVASLATVYLVLLLLKAWLAVRTARHAPQPGDRDLAQVVIVQPILSGDPRLIETLEDNVRMLPSSHFVWLVDTDDGAAGEVCQTLRNRHEAARIDVLVLPPPPDGVNPKLFKLEEARRVVGDRVMLVLDDDTRMPAASLSVLLEGLTQSELATGLPAYVDDGRWPSQLLAQFVNNNAALTYLPMANLAPPVTINGMAYAMRGETIDGLGGFGPLLGAITDDLAVARHVLAGGGRICQTAAPVWVQTTLRNGRHYVRQMHRWFLFALLLWCRQPPGLQGLIALFHATPPLLLWGMAAALALRPTAAGFVALALLLTLRASVLTALQVRIYGRPLHEPLFSAASELLQPLHMAHAVFVRTIVWRTRRYRVHGDQTFQVLP